MFKEIFNKGFEARKNQTDIGLTFERVEPDIMGEVISKDNVIFEVVNRLNKRCPFFRKDDL